MWSDIIGNQKDVRKPRSYERTLFLFLSLYRFFGYILAVILIQVVTLNTPDTADDPDRLAYIILGVVGIYTVFKVFSPVRWQQKVPTTYAVLGVDLVVCVLIVMFSGGLDSGYLIYALSPVITAAFLFEENTALVMASLSSLPLLVAHVGLSHWNSSFAWIMQGTYLPMMIVYIMVCFLIATLTFRTNLNIRLRIETDAIFDERRRIRGELHDGVAQGLSYIRLRASLMKDAISSLDAERALADLEDIQKVVKETYDDVRESIDSMSTRMIFPLAPTLASYLDEFSEKHKIETEFDSPEGQPRLSPTAEFQLLRIAHEALTNVRRHAAATKVWVKLDNGPDGLVMSIRDNGRGFPSTAASPSSHGLNIMKERAESLGGSCDITSSPGKGTEIVIQTPAEKVRF